MCVCVCVCVCVCAIVHMQIPNDAITKATKEKKWSRRLRRNTHRKNSVKTILGLSVQGGNIVKTVWSCPGFVEQKPC